jgi:hypothetical protein
MAKISLFVAVVVIIVDQIIIDYLHHMDHGYGKYRLFEANLEGSAAIRSTYIHTYILLTYACTYCTCIYTRPMDYSYTIFLHNKIKQGCQLECLVLMNAFGIFFFFLL